MNNLKAPAKSLRLLILAPDSNPFSISTSLVGYSHSEALAQIHEVTLVTREANVEAHRQRPSKIRAVESVSLPWLDRIADWGLRKIFKSDYSSQAYTVFNYPFQVAFEWQAWRQLRRRIKSGEFDVVLRVLPVSPVLPSAFVFFLKKTKVPFVIGPLNGGLPWPQGFQQAEDQREWLSGLRDIYRFMPFAQGTFANATAIIAGSSQTFSEFSKYREKVFFIPENGISRAVYNDGELPRPPRDSRFLHLIYVGRLVPFKACDMALKAAAPLLKAGSAFLTIVGDGSERQVLEEMAESLGVSNSVSFTGWVSHDETLKLLKKADILVFPSIREFGGGVVFEALAFGTVPVVADFGGPGDIVNTTIGFKARMTNEADVISQLESIINQLAADPSLLDRLSQQGKSHAREHLTWDAKARLTTQVLYWVLGLGPKPELGPPKVLPPRNQRMPVPVPASRAVRE